jgi:hypothetical protein
MLNSVQTIMTAFALTGALAVGLGLGRSGCGRCSRILRRQSRVRDVGVAGSNPATSTNT